MRIAIIGYKGGMGQWFTRFFKEKGLETKGYEVSEWEHNGGFQEDVLLVSVPLAVSVEVLTKIGKMAKKEQLVCDISSLKVKQMEALKGSKAQILGLHPLFGPSMAMLAGQVVLHTRVQGDISQRFLALFSQGTCVEVESKKHDELMATIQGFVHVHTLVFARMLQEQGLSSQEALTFRTPTFQMLMSIAGRLSGQDPALYAEMVYGNPCMGVILAHYAHVVQKFCSQEKSSFIDTFKQVAKFFQEYTPQATAETDRAFYTYATPLKLQSPILVRALPAVAQSAKGSTYEWCKNEPGLQVTYYTRTKGTHFANHAHTGEDLSKTPERFLLLTGNVEIHWRTKGEHGKEQVDGVSEVLIAPGVYHEFVALSDCSFIEYRRTAFDPKRPDSLSSQEYDLYISRKS
jgi:prephenate dehydrogenase